MQDKSACEVSVTDCCACHLLGIQPDFKEQQSLVQEVIEAAGHECIFLPKFHWELNFIEFFWVQSSATRLIIVIIPLTH